MRTEKSQYMKILRYMETHEDGITSMDAINLFGCTRLSAIIWTLRHDGYLISFKWEGQGQTMYKRYFLKGAL